MFFCQRLVLDLHEFVIFCFFGLIFLVQIVQVIVAVHFTPNFLTLKFLLNKFLRLRLLGSVLGRVDTKEFCARVRRGIKIRLGGDY